MIQVLTFQTMWKQSWWCWSLSLVITAQDTSAHVLPRGKTAVSKVPPAANLKMVRFWKDVCPRMDLHVLLRTCFWILYIYMQYQYHYSIDYAIWWLVIAIWQSPQEVWWNWRFLQWRFGWVGFLCSTGNLGSNNCSTTFWVFDISHTQKYGNWKAPKAITIHYL